MNEESHEHKFWILYTISSTGGALSLLFFLNLFFPLEIFFLLNNNTCGFFFFFFFFPLCVPPIMVQDKSLKFCFNRISLQYQTLNE